MMVSQSVPILNTARVTRLNAVAISPTPDMESSGIQGQPIARETPVVERFPIASEPNIQAFRRFGIDEFDIPPGDDFAAMAQVSFKKKKESN
jgi:hypothetical protein